MDATESSSAVSFFKRDKTVPDFEGRLSFDIPAVEVLPGKIGVAALGLFVTLPMGAEIKTCGEGFNLRTVKIACGPAYYYVFRQDLPDNYLGRSSKSAAG